MHGSVSAFDVGSGLADGPLVTLNDVSVVPGVVSSGDGDFFRDL